MKKQMLISGHYLGLLATIALLICVVANPVFAQLPTGTILGVVKDPSGAAVPNATVTVRNIETDLSRTGTTGNDGAYRFPALPVGHYSVDVSRSGFKMERHTGLVLEVGQEAVMDFTLQVGTSTEVVEVTGEPALVETTNSAMGGVVNEQKMADLPLNGRNYIELSLLQPGIAHAASAGGTGDRSVGTWFSSNGAPPRSNNIMLDGARVLTSMSTTSASPGGTTLGVDGIQEYRVITDMFGAEYGMSMGSQVMLVSKGGTNKFHGDVFEYFRNSSLDARNFFDYGYLGGGPRLPPFHRNNFGASAGGPIKKDKTFFYAVYEGLRQSTGLSIVNQVFDASCYDSNHAILPTGNPCATASGGVVNPAILPIANLFPYPNLGSNEWTAPAAATSTENYGQIRVDHNFSTVDSLFGRYTIDQSMQLNPQEFPQFANSIPGRNQFLTLSEIHLFSSAIVNTVRASFSRTNSLNTPVTNGLPACPNCSYVPGAPIGTTVIFSFANPAFGPSERSPQFNLQNVYTLSDDLFYTKGRHSWKFGVLYNRFNLAQDGTIAANGTAAFGDVPSFLAGIAANFQSARPASIFNRFYIFNTLGFYAQDDFRVTPRLTLNLGLRYEFNTAPRESNGRQYAFLNIRTDTATTQGPIMRNPSLKNFSPRIGFAWDVTGKGKTSVRGGFGEYYDVGNIGSYLTQHDIAIPPLSTASSASGVITVPFTFSPADVGAFVHAGDYYSGQPHLLQYNLGVQQLLPWGTALSVAYVGSRGLDLFTVRDQNPTIPTSVTNGVAYWDPLPEGPCPNPSATGSCRINPNWGPMTMVTTGASSWYNSLQVVMNKHISHGLEAQASYTWSKSLDTAQSMMYVYDCFSAAGGSHGIDPANPLTDKGPSCFDVTHNFRLNVLYHFPNIKSNNFAARILHGWWMGNIISLQSGYPFSPNTVNLLSNSGVFGADQGERPNIVTQANLAAAQAVNPSAVVYSPSTVTLGRPDNWFNVNMFTLVGPNATTACLAADPKYPMCSFGIFGNASRDMLRGPGMRTWDFSLNKDTALPFLGEGGKLEFRAEIFNLLNHANFGLPGGTIFNAAVTNETPIPSGSQITGTATTSRQVQFALKIIF